jgi:hypothetical protein
VKRVTPYSLDAGGSVPIEVEEDGGATVTRGLHPGKSLEVERGLELAGQAGAFIASVSTEVQLAWTRSIENLSVSISATNRLHIWVADRCPG